MYEDFYGLKEQPWAVLPDPKYAYRSMAHQIAEGKVRFAADYKQGLAVLTGPVGCGKTTVANGLIRDWSTDETKVVAYLPVADDRGKSSFLARIMDGFDLESSRLYSSNRNVLERFMLNMDDQGKHAVLVIDEAQKIHADNLDTIVDLTNFQTADRKFLTIILIAQDNFSNKLRTKDAFRSRIAFHGHLDPLSFDDTIGMIAYRLKVAGAKIKGENPEALKSFLTLDALTDVYQITRGVPRDICVLLSSLFLESFVLDSKPIQAADVARTLAEMAKIKAWPVQEVKVGK